MKILIFLTVVIVSVVVARPAEDVQGNKEGDDESPANDMQNLKHFRRPVYYFYQNHHRNKICPGGYQIYNPFGPAVILNQGQGSGANGIGNEQGSGTGVGQVIGVNNGYVFGSSPYPNCKDGPNSNCKEGTVVQLKPGIILKPDEIYGGGVNLEENIKPVTEDTFETNEGSPPGFGFIQGSVTGNVGFETSVEGGTRPIPGGGQGTGSLCKRCPANQQATKPFNLDRTKANNDTHLLADKSLITPIKNDSKVKKKISESL